MATYRVVPFVASINLNQGADQAAAQLESLIKGWSDAGWEYVRLESVETRLSPVMPGASGSARCRHV